MLAQTAPNTDMAEQWRIQSLLVEHPKWVDTLQEALEVEAAGREKSEGTGYGYLGWEWHEVHTNTATLNLMVSSRLLDIPFKSNSSTEYLLREPESIQQVLDQMESHVVPLGIVNPHAMPTDLFSLIVGHEGVKKILGYAIEAERPCHCLLSGPPASAKTLFLMDLARIPDSSYLLAPTVSSAGLVDHLFMYRPRVLLIDEIDRFAGDGLGILNSLMATGHVSETKYHKTREIDLETKVFGAGIRIQKLPHDVMSRFVLIEFDPYTREEFEEIASAILPALEEVEGEVAQYIAHRVWKVSTGMSDIRQVIQIARMSGGDRGRIDEIMDTISLTRRV